jgi:peptide/nickel transport system permease protein
MLGLITLRLVGALPTLLIVSFIAFAIVRLIPGDPAAVIAGASASVSEVERIREQLGLDRPFLEQIASWYGNMLRGDLGDSIMLRRSVIQAIVERLPVTLSLALISLLWTVLLGLAAGVAAALRPLTWVDHAILGSALVGVSMPNFWLALMLVQVFSVSLGWLPTSAYVPLTESLSGWALSLVLPSIALALPQVAIVARTVRATMLEVLRLDYIRTAEAKGLSRMAVVGKHALKNALVAVLTVIGISFGILLSGSVVIETVFALPGVGRLLATSVLTRDYPVIQGGLLLTATVLVLLNLLIDVLYAAIDPRIRYGRR